MLGADFCAVCSGSRFGGTLSVGHDGGGADLASVLAIKSPFFDVLPLAATSDFAFDAVPLATASVPDLAFALPASPVLEVLALATASVPDFLSLSLAISVPGFLSLSLS